MCRGSSDQNSEGVIPPSEPKPTDVWIESNYLPRVPRQDLLPEEAEAFLEYLLSEVVRRPRPLRLRQGARVARYLDALAWETEPGAIRQLLERLRDGIWGTLLQLAPLELSSKPEAIAFLERHAETYLAGLNVEAALQRVRESTRCQGSPLGVGATAGTGHQYRRCDAATGGRRHREIQPTVRQADADLGATVTTASDETSMKVSPRAEKPVASGMLVNVPKLLTAYNTEAPGRR